MTQLRNFGFMIPKKLAGMAYVDLSLKNLKFLKKKNIHGIVNLTIRPMKEKLIEKQEMEYLRIPISQASGHTTRGCQDGPTIEQAVEFCKFVKKMNRKEKGVVVCCATHGKTMTGLLMAVYLIYRSGAKLSAAESIKKVKTKRPGSVGKYTFFVEEMEELFQKHFQDSENIIT